MDVVPGPRGVGERLLTDEHERAPRHAATVDLALAGDDLGEGPARVHGARTPRGLVRPRHAPGDGEVDLERSWAGAVAPVGPRDARGEPLAGDLGKRAGGEVEHDRVGRGELGQRSDASPGLEAPAVLADDGGSRAISAIPTA